MKSLKTEKAGDKNFQKLIYDLLQFLNILPPYGTEGWEVWR